MRVLATGLATYPDMTIVCGPRELDPEDRNTATNPTLLVEVLSPSSASYASCTRSPPTARPERHPPATTSGRSLPSGTWSIAAEFMQ